MWEDKNTARKLRINVLVTDQERRAIAAAARHQGTDSTSIVRRALAAYLPTVSPTRRAREEKPEENGDTAA